MDKFLFPRRAVAAAVLLLSTYAMSGQVNDLRIQADDVGIHVQLDSLVGTVQRTGITRDGRHFVMELSGVKPEQVETFLGKNPKTMGLLTDVFVRPLGADGTRLVIGLSESSAIDTDMLVTTGVGQVQKAIKLLRTTAPFDLKMVSSQSGANEWSAKLDGAGKFSASVSQAGDASITLDMEQVSVARAERVLADLKAKTDWVKSIEVQSTGQGARAVVQFQRAVELAGAERTVTANGASQTLRVRPAPALNDTGIAGVSLKGLEAKIGSGAASLVLVAPVGLEVKAISGETPQELRLSLRGVNRKRADELVADFRPTHPDVLGATVVSGDQRSSVIAIKLARPMSSDPVVQAKAGADTVVRLGAPVATAAARPAAAPLPQVTKPAMAAKAIVLDAVAPVDVPAATTPVKALALLDALALAEAKDPKLAAARSELAAQLETKEQAIAGYLPKVVLESSINRNDQRTTPYAVNTQTQRDFNSRNVTLSITQPLIRVAAGVQISQAERVVEQARLTFAASEQDLLVRLSAAYLSVMAAQDGVSVAQAEREALEKQYMLALTRQRSGLANVTEISDTEARFAVSKAREIESANALADARMALREIVGTDIGEIKAGVRDFDAVMPTPTDPAAWKAAALKQNLNVQARERASEAAKLEVRKQQAAYGPTVDLVASASKGSQGDYLAGSNFTGGYSSTGNSVGVRMNWPIFEGGMTRSQVREAVARLSKADMELEAERLVAERQASSTLLSVSASSRLMEALRSSLVAQETALVAKSKGLDAGLFSVVQVADAYRLTFAAKRDFLKARYDYLLNRIKLKQAIGALTRQDVADVAELIN
jgi:outer membrane protein